MQNIGLFDNGGLFSLLEKLSSESNITQTTQTPPFITNTIHVKLQIFECENIISSGFKCIAHFVSGNDCVEIELEIEKLISKKVFAKRGEIVDTICKLKYPVYVSENTRILLRSSDMWYY